MWLSLALDVLFSIQLNGTLKYQLLLDLFLLILQLTLVGDLYRDEVLSICIAGPNAAGRRGSFYRLVWYLFPK